jgi:hypothetical protein
VLAERAFLSWRWYALTVVVQVVSGVDEQEMDGVKITAERSLMLEKL